jgi:uncharacterized protein (TIGR02594 family)
MLPSAYAWLEKEPGPKMLREAVALHGVREKIGPADNPEIMQWAKECGIGYAGDSVPWCGLFMAVCARRAGWISTPANNALWALNWGHWGDPSPRPMLGDVLTFRRPTGGHVGFYVGEDFTAFHVLGGNQGDAVSIVRILRGRLHKARRAPWRIAQPANVRVVALSMDGAPLSTNEA